MFISLAAMIPDLKILHLHIHKAAHFAHQKQGLHPDENSKII